MRVHSIIINHPKNGVPPNVIIISHLFKNKSIERYKDTKVDLTNWLETPSKGSKGSHQCEHCGFLSKKKQNLEKHVLRFHSNIEAKHNFCVEPQINRGRSENAQRTCGHFVEIL